MENVSVVGGREVLEAGTPEDLEKREKELIGQLGEPVSH